MNLAGQRSLESHAGQGDDSYGNAKATTESPSDSSRSR